MHDAFHALMAIVAGMGIPAVMFIPHMIRCYIWTRRLAWRELIAFAMNKENH